MFNDKKGFLDDFVDVAWTCFFIIVIAILVGIYSEAKKSSVQDRVDIARSEIARDSSLLDYLRTPITGSDGNTKQVIDWIDQALLTNPSDPVGECKRLIGPQTNALFLQKAGQKGYSFVVEQDNIPICQLGGGSFQGQSGTSSITLPSVFPGKTLDIRLGTVSQ